MVPPDTLTPELEFCGELDDLLGKSSDWPICEYWFEDAIGFAENSMPIYDS